MNNAQNSKNENLGIITDLLKKGSKEDTREYCIVNRTNDPNLRQLYEYLKEKILNWDNDIYVDSSPGYITFKIDGIDNRNIVACYFYEKYMDLTLPFKPKDEENILNQWKLKNKQAVHRIFISSNEKVSINKTKGHPNPKKIILEINENDNEETYYKFKKENGDEIPINHIINFIKQNYNKLIQKFQ